MISTPARPGSRGRPRCPGSGPSGSACPPPSAPACPSPCLESPCHPARARGRHLGRASTTSTPSSSTTTAALELMMGLRPRHRGVDPRLAPVSKSNSSCAGVATVGPGPEGGAAARTPILPPTRWREVYPSIGYASHDAARAAWRSSQRPPWPASGANRPEARNAFDGLMATGLAKVLFDLNTVDSVRVVVLGGRGPAFCAGADREPETRRPWPVSAAEQNLRAALGPGFSLLHRVREPSADRGSCARRGAGGGLRPGGAASDIPLAGAGHPFRVHSSYARASCLR